MARERVQDIRKSPHAEARPLTVPEEGALVDRAPFAGGRAEGPPTKPPLAPATKTRSLTADLRETEIQQRTPWRCPREGSFIVAVSRRGTVKCKRCGGRIEEGKLQFGIFFQHQEGFSALSWYHLEEPGPCVKPPVTVSSVWEIDGIDDVGENNIQRVAAWLDGEEAVAGGGSGSGSGGGSGGIFKDRSWTL